MRRACWVVVGWCLACGTGETPPLPEPSFTGDFVLAFESDWPGGEACQYVSSADQTTCSWGRLSISVDSIVRSVLGSDVHQGDRLGPLVHEDSTVYAVRVGVGNGCTVFVAGNTIKPNGPGVLAADSLRFTGLSLLGDSIRWVYVPVRVQQPRSCG